MSSLDDQFVRSEALIARTSKTDNPPHMSCPDNNNGNPLKIRIDPKVKSLLKELIRFCHRMTTKLVIHSNIVSVDVS
jgi:hypothetical protein